MPTGGREWLWITPKVGQAEGHGLGGHGAARVGVDDQGVGLDRLLVDGVSHSIQTCNGLD